MTKHLLLYLGLVIALALAGCDSGSLNEPAGRRDALRPALDLGMFGPVFDVESGEMDGEMDDDDGDGESEEVEVEGEDVRLTFGGGPPLDQEVYNFEVESEDGEVEGIFKVRDFDADGNFLVVSGKVTCVTVEPDGITARLGGEVTRSRDNVGLPDFAGTFAVWTVIANEDGPAQVTDLRFGIGNAAVPDFHCNVGFPLDVFDIILADGTVIFDAPAETTGEIEIEVGD